MDIKNENILSRMTLPGSALQLAIFRIALGLQIFYSSSSQLIPLLKEVKGSGGTMTIFPSVVNDLIASIVTPYLVFIVQVLSVCLVLGLFTRYILPFLFISFLMLFSFWYLKFNAPVPWLYIWFPLLILCFTRCSDVLSLDKKFNWAKLEKEHSYIYRWPVEVVTGWFAYIYFAAGLAKILPFTKGIAWLDGATGQKIVYERFLDSFLFYAFGKPFFDYTEHSWFFAILSFLSLLVELSCLVLFFSRKYNYIIIVSVLVMHAFLWATGVQGFFLTALLLSVCLISPHLFEVKKK